MALVLLAQMVNSEIKNTVCSVPSLCKSNQDKIKCCLTVKTELLLCDLLLNFSHPVQADVSREDEEKSQEQFKNKNYHFC